MRSSLEALKTEISELSEEDTLTEEQEARFDEALEEAEGFKSKIEASERRAEKAKLVREWSAPTEYSRESGSVKGPEVIIRKDPIDVAEDRSASGQDLVDAATRGLEKHDVSAEDMAHVRSVLNKHREDTKWARQLIVRDSEAYEEAFSKYLKHGDVGMLTDSEKRAVSIGTNTAGGFLVPTHLDPTIMLSNAGSANAIRPISRVVTLTEGSTWNGVTSAGVTGAWVAEEAEVGDNAPELASAAIPVHKASAFVPVSIEAAADTGIAGELQRLFADARDRLEGAAHCTGSGSGQPTGIFTALDANTNVEIESTTAATIGVVDLEALRTGLGVRFRRNSTWVMNPEWLHDIHDLGTAVSNSFTTDLTEELTQRLFGRPVVETDDAPNVKTTTALDNRIVLGDFSNYVIVDKPGSMSVEFIPHLFATGANRPSGQRGFYAYWRTGADSAVDLAFRLLQDKTSA